MAERRKRRCSNMLLLTGLSGDVIYLYVCISLIGGHLKNIFRS